MVSSSRCSAWPAIRRERNSASTLKWNPGQVEVELEPERELPVDPGAHGIGRLAVAEMLEKLEDGDQGQTPRGQSGLPPARIKRPKVLVSIKDVELLA